MLARLIEEARAEMHAAQDQACKKFDEYMTAPLDGDDAEKKREMAMESAWNDYHRAQGVLEGLMRAQEYLSVRASA